MSDCWRPSLWWQLLGVLAATANAFAGWEFTPAGDPDRNWSANVTLRGLYDDNFNATEANRQSGLRFQSNLRLLAKVPVERLLLGARYDYGVEYPRDVNLGEFNETHNFLGTLNYTFNPRLTLNVNENFIQSLQPQLVQSQAGTPVTVVQAGTYIYDSVSGTLTYLLGPRWRASIAGSWDIIRYQDRAVAQFSDHEDYQTTLSIVRALNPRTALGLSYRYERNLFTNPGTNDVLNGQANSGYITFVRKFNPRMSLELDGGYTLREGDDGTQTTAPFVYSSLIYQYGPESTLSASAGHSLSAASVGITRDFSASENTTLALQINHRVTIRLRALADFAYTFSTFESALPGRSSTTAEEQAITGHLGVNYAFRVWLSVVADYYYTKLFSDLAGRAYERNQIGVGVTLSY